MEPPWAPRVRADRALALPRTRSVRHAAGALSTQRDHAHLIVEPESRGALSRAMQGLGVRIARALNRLMGLEGAVFADRYRDRVLRTPRQVRSAIQYVLCNGRKHGVVPETVRVDPLSSAAAFDGWLGGVASELATSVAASVVVPARTWLMTRGWRRGGPLDPMHRPGPPGPSMA